MAVHCAAVGAPPLRTFAIRASRHPPRIPRIRAHKAFTHAIHSSSSSSSRHRHGKEARVPPSLAMALVAILSTTTYLLGPSGPPTLNDTTFAPHTITARDAVSPSSVLLTVSPQNHDPSPPYLLPRSTSPTWKYPLWSLEFKQPEVQIARHYTPLPPHDEDPLVDGGKLRFYIRGVRGGEMSSYLVRLRVGDTVHLRGPHPGFDVLRRLGDCTKVVFLAGGTGVVPGMQVASAVLESSDSSRVDLLWAVRRREEVQSGAVAQHQQRQPWWKAWTTRARPALGELTTDMDRPSAVARQLMHLKAMFGERLRVRLAVDEEHTRFTVKDVQSALLGGTRSRACLVDQRGCQLHDQRLHAQASEFEDPATRCRCGDSPGKNLLMVSGPEGFVAHYAGDKIWRRGMLTQGPVGGVAGRLQRTDPSFASEWLVLKL